MAVIDGNGVFPNNQRADVMRNSMENKNLLANRGSIYVGTGNSSTIGSDTVYRTAALSPVFNGSSIIDDYVIITDNSSATGLDFKPLSGISVGNSSRVYVTVSNVATITSGFKEITIVDVLPSNPVDSHIYFVTEG